MNQLESKTNNIWKWLALLIISIFSIYVLFPVQDKVRLGLDLKGGTSFTLGVDKEALADALIAEDASLTNDAERLNRKIEETLVGADDRIVQVVRRRVDGLGLNEPVIQGMKGHRLLVQLPGIDEKARREAKESIQSSAVLEFRLVDPQNRKHVEDLLNSDAVPDGYVKGGSGYVRAANYAEVSSAKDYKRRLAQFGVKDHSYQFMLEKEDDGSYRPCFVKRSGPIKGKRFTGEYLKSSSVERDPMTGKFHINFKLNSEGGQLFSQITRNYMPNGSKNPSPNGRQLAIILDNTLISAPEIQSEINTSGQITGSFTAGEAQRLSNDLNSGALPAPLEILAETSVSPTVGEDAINAGIWAATIGFALVALFMLIYYFAMGFVADIALFLDVALLPAALVLVANVLGVFAKDASVGQSGTLNLPVLTMPGIAGLVLTLGMAVDANVLIFERIREEFQRKANAGEAIARGYGRAFTAIVDSNITTILTGVILFIVGSGPVRGFAITLTAGVIISMFTAVVVTRLVLDHTVNPARTAPFKMLQFFKAPNFQFVKYGKLTTIASFVIIIASLAVFGFRLKSNPASVLAVDLTGGTSIVYDYDQAAKPAIEDVRKALNDFDNAATIQYQDGGVSKGTLLVKTGLTTESKKVDVPAKVTELLQKAIPASKIEMKSADEVGSLVGADLKKSGTLAVVFSLVAVLVYVAFRFEFGFGVGALIALAHDALITLGLFSLCGRQVSLIVVTALLTIVGYSVNDTIVVFDRIREDLRHDKRTPFLELCNRAINANLGRTVITSLTTFFAVLALFAFGDGSIFDFALAMLIGVVTGTYSSIFIATPIMIAFYRGRRPSFEEETDKE